MKRILLVSIIVVLVFFGYCIYFKTDLFTISEIIFNEEYGLDQYAVQKYSNVHYGDLYFSIDTDQAQLNLEEHPFVKEASVEKEFPNLVRITVEYRGHEISLVHSNIILSLDEDLVVLEVLDNVKTGYCVEGFSFDSFRIGEKIDTNNLKELKNIQKLTILLGKISIPIDKNIKFYDNDIVIDANGITAKFGDGDNIESKFNDFHTIYKELIKMGTDEGVIDVSVDGVPVYIPFGKQ